MNEVVYVAMIAFVGGLVQGLTGFGVMLVSLPLMAFFINIKTAIPLILMLGMVINCILIFQLASFFDFKKLMPLFVSACPGIPAGIFIHRSVSARPLEILVGVVLLMTSGATLKYHRRTRELKKYWSYAAGFASGCLAGSIGAAGPPVIAYASFQPWSKQEMKATLVFFFMASGTSVFCFYLFYGLITREILDLFACCSLPLVAGVFSGVSLYGRIDETGYRKCVHILLGLLGIMMLIK